MTQLSNIKPLKWLKATLFVTLAVLMFSSLPGVAGAQQISFKDDVLPVFQLRCAECHSDGGSGTLASGLNLSSYADVMAGGKFGPMIIPGNWLESNLLAVIEHRTAPEMWMPHNRGPLSKCEVLSLRFWVLQGAQDN